MPRVGDPGVLTPYWQTADNGGTARLYQGHAPAVLPRLAERSVQCVVTSPPYWSLRDYKTGSAYEIGAEPTLVEYVANLVETFRAVRRVLRDDGTVWLNLGDAYGDDGSLLGMPWRVAFALQADGWILRQDIIWHKPGPMPESVNNRCTKAHEYLFLLAKSKGYYYDAEAIKERGSGGFPGNKDGGHKYERAFEDGDRRHQTKSNLSRVLPATRINRRSVWTVGFHSYAAAHFATFPPKLVEPCILAGTSERGACAGCGAPWRRVVESRGLKRSRPNDYVKRTGEPGTGNSCANSVAGVETRTIGWEPTCKCLSSEELEQADCLGAPVTSPCVVLDPFVGSGTTVCVALEQGRAGIGIDLSAKYLAENAVPRLTGTLLSRPALSGLIPRPVGPGPVYGRKAPSQPSIR